MRVWLFILTSFSRLFCSYASLTFNSSTARTSSTHFPLSIPRPLLPYFQSVSKASKRQPRLGLTVQEEKEYAKSDFQVDSDNKVEAGTGLKVENLELQKNLGQQKNLGLRVPPVVREHYMKGRSGRQIVPGVYSCGHQVSQIDIVAIPNPVLKYFLKGSDQFINFINPHYPRYLSEKH